VDFESFIAKTRISVEDLCREIFRGNPGTIRIKKEETAVKNLVALYNATLKLSAGKGFGSMTLRDLCRESGLSMGALYSYITCKEDLLNILQNYGLQYISRILLAAVETETDPKNKLHAMIRANIYLSEALPDLFTFFFMESKNLGRDVQKVMIAAELFTEQMICRVLEDGNRTGDFTTADPLMTASHIKPLLQDWYLKRWKYTGRGVTVDDYAASVISLVDAHVRPKGPARP
jgi:AcrR family transcriptional regulator